MTVKKKTGSVGLYIFWFATIIALFGCGYYLYTVVSGMPIIPQKYIEYLVYGLLGLGALTLLVALLAIKSRGAKVFQSVMCLLLAGAMVYGSLEIPKFQGTFERMWTVIPEEGEMNINVYVAASSPIRKLDDLLDKKVAIVKGIDEDYQDYALKVISNELGGKTLTTSEYEDIYAAAEALNNGETEALLLNQSYAEILGDNVEFTDFNEKNRILYTCIQKIKLDFDTTAVGDITTSPFVIMVGGRDDWGYTRINKTTSAGRTDTNMLMVVNPKTKQLLVVTIPRDSYVALDGNKKKMDKLTHATVYSLNTWLKSVSSFLDVDINYFLRINFSSFINVVDAIGGIDVVNPSYFKTTYNPHYTIDGQVVVKNYEFPEGPLHLDGRMALCFVRERHYGNQGDLGRNKRQAIAIKAIIDKVTTVEQITHFADLMKAVEGTFFTDINVNQIYALAQMQLNDMATWDIVSYSLSGKSEKATSYAMGTGNGPIFDVVKISDSSLQKAQNLITKVLNNEKVTV
ncbi:MAG: LCP family protein, partial [Erysipelotrichaceae bacterium]|nr:LCP family protein [Erysipelotrichaceae bacterium]